MIITMTTGKRWLSVFLAISLMMSMLLMAGNDRSYGEPARAGFYQTSGNRILDHNGNPAVFNGLNWFGFETENYSPHGLWSNSMEFYLDLIKQRGYNLIRLPYSNQMFDPGVMPTSIDYVSNPGLAGKTPIQIMDKLIEEAGKRNIKIILDRHRPGSAGQSELWYTPQYSEERWISDWVMLANRYAGNPTVIGADLHNEPHTTATWGTGSLTTDWRLAAERAGNAILAANPDWLILVEGVSTNVQGVTSNYWWGGNLKGVRNYPVRLNVTNRLVYSPHDYGPGVASQKWFEDASFPSNMPAIWDEYWGYIHKENIAPILVGEFGGRSVDTVSVEGKWQNKLVDYIKENDLYWTYWSFNPNSGDTGGLLLDDWRTWNEPKQTMLSRIMKSLDGGGTNPEPVIPSAPASLTATAGDAKISLSWSSATGASTYNVKRSTSSSGAYTTIATGVSGTSYVDTGLSNGTTYYYVVSAVNSVGESVNSTQVSAVPTAVTIPQGNVILQYRTGDTNSTDNQLKPHFNLVNQGSAPVELSDLTIRYYFTKDGSQALSAWVDWAQLGSSNVQTSFGTSSGESSDTYLEVRFTEGAGSLPAGGQTGDIQLRIAKSDWSNFNEANDYSYDATKTAYTAWDKVTVYQNGTLIYGIEP